MTKLAVMNNAEWIATIIITRFSGLLSFAGSSLILFIIFADCVNKWKRIHYRLLAGICFFDVLYSLCMIVSTAAIPKDTDDGYHIRGNIGNTATCKAQGFLLQLGALGMPLYLASLSLYYLLVIRYNVNDDVIRRKVEPFMHIISIAFPLGTAIAALCLNLYHHKLLLCWIEAEPFGCTVDESIECTEAANAPKYEVAFAGIWFALVFIFEVICMGLIYGTVRKRERVMNAFSFRGRNGRILVHSSNRVTVERRDTAIQAILYISAFVFTYVWPFVSFFMFHVTNARPNFVFVLMTMFFTPLLGFWNFLAFIRPRYMKLAREHRNVSFWWKMKTILSSRINAVPASPPPITEAPRRLSIVTQSRRFSITTAAFFGANVSRRGSIESVTNIGTIATSSNETINHHVIVEDTSND